MHMGIYVDDVRYRDKKEFSCCLNDLSQHRRGWKKREKLLLSVWSVKSGWMTLNGDDFKSFEAFFMLKFLKLKSKLCIPCHLRE